MIWRYVLRRGDGYEYMIAKDQAKHGCWWEIRCAGCSQVVMASVDRIAAGEVPVECPMCGVKWGPEKREEDTK